MLHVLTQNTELDEGASVSKRVDKSSQRATWTPTPTPTPFTGKEAAAVPMSKDEIRRIFNKYDTDKDGCISKQELNNAFKSLGSHMPRVRAWLALQYADVTGDGFINEAEFYRLVKYSLKRGYKFDP